MPSRWSVGEGHVGIEVLEHIGVGVPGVGEDGLFARDAVSVSLTRICNSDRTGPCGRAVCAA
jgi:hypothetical protein